MGGGDIASISIKNITKVFPNGTEAVKDFNLEIADYENIAFGLRARKTPKAEIDALVKKAASVLSINHLLSRKPKQLSGGERQRVAMGRAIVRNPNVFLMDEPLAKLDALLRVEMRAELSLLHSQLKGTFVFVTHDQIEAMTLADRIVVMKSGVVQQVGTPKEIYNNPINKFVAGFIGSPQMNFIKCGEGVEAGIRPEAVMVHEQDDAEGRRIKCRVEIIELLGQEIILYLHIEDTDFEKKFETQYLRERMAGVSSGSSAVAAQEKNIGEMKAVDFKLVARVKPDSNLKVGDAVFVEFDENKMCYFDAKTEERAFRMG